MERFVGDHREFDDRFFFNSGSLRELVVARNKATKMTEDVEIYRIEIVKLFAVGRPSLARPGRFDDFLKVETRFSELPSFCGHRGTDDHGTWIFSFYPDRKYDKQR